MKRLFPCEVSPLFVKFLFPSAILHCANVSNSGTVSFDSGEVTLTLDSQPHHAVPLVNLSGSVVWADFFGDHIGFLLSCGNLYVGSLAQDKPKQLQWSSISLPVSPICGCCIGGDLLFSDGVFSYVYDIPKQGALSGNFRKLSLFGVVGIKKKQNEFLCSTCDGRNYNLSQSSIKQESSIIKSNDVPVLFSQTCDASSVANSLKFITTKFSKDCYLENINSYINQLSLLQYICSRNKNSVFNVKTRVSEVQSASGFQIIVLITRLLLDVRFDGPWWQLNVKLKSTHSVGCVFNILKLKVDPNKEVMELKLKIPQECINSLIYRRSQFVIDVILSFSQYKLDLCLCSFTVYRNNLDIFSFLSKSASQSQSLNCFNVHALNNSSFDFSEDIGNLINRCVQTTKRSTLVRNSDLLFLKDTLDVNLTDFPFSSTFWVGDQSVFISGERVNSKYCRIHIEGNNYKLIEALSCSLTYLALNINSSESKQTKVILDFDIYRKVLLIKAIIDMKSAGSHNGMTVLGVIHDAIHDLLSNIVE